MNRSDALIEDMEEEEFRAMKAIILPMDVERYFTFRARRWTNWL